MDNSFRLLSDPGLLPVNRRLLLVCGAVTKVEIYKVLIGYSRFLCQIFEVRHRAFIKINGYLALCFAVVGATLSFGKIIFFSHAIPPYTVCAQLWSPFGLR